MTVVRGRLARLRALDLEVATRAACAVAVPLLLLFALHRLDLAAYASFGAFTSLYGRSEPYRLRIRSVSVAGAALVVSVAGGTLLAALHAPVSVALLALLLVTAGGTLLGATFGLLPRNSLFYVFALLVCAEIPTPIDQVGLRILISLAAAVFAWLLSLSGWLLRRVITRPALFKPLPRRPQLRTGAVTSATVWWAVLQTSIGVVLAGAIALLLGMGHPYWAVVSVVAVIPPAGARHSTSRAVHRVVGTLGGIIVAALILLPDPPPLVPVLVAIIAQFFAEILVGKHYGAALLFITPLAVCVAHLSSTAAVPALLLDRIVQTVLGAAVGVLIVLTARGLAARSGPRAGRLPG